MSGLKSRLELSILSPSSLVTRARIGGPVGGAEGLHVCQVALNLPDQRLHRKRSWPFVHHSHISSRRE